MRNARLPACGLGAMMLLAVGASACSLMLDTTELASSAGGGAGTSAHTRGGATGEGGTAGELPIAGGGAGDGGASGGPAGTAGTSGEGGVPGVAGTTSTAGAAGCMLYRDADEDGYGDPSAALADCTPSPGYVSNGADCDDGDVLRNPAIREHCDGIDNDCSPATADICPPSCTTEMHLGRPYMTCATLATHEEAAEHCTLQAMRLTRIESADENNFVTSLLKGRPYAWIGATDISLEGTWRWSDGVVFYSNGQAVNGMFTAWYQGEPTNQDNSDCAEIWDDYTWDDYVCNAPQAFICERY